MVSRGEGSPACLVRLPFAGLVQPSPTSFHPFARAFRQTFHRGAAEGAASRQHCRHACTPQFQLGVLCLSQHQVSRNFRLPLSFMTRAHRQAADRPAVAICARIDVHVKRPAGARQRARPSLQAVPIPIARCTVVVMASDRVTCHLTLKRPLTFCEGG